MTLGLKTRLIYKFRKLNDDSLIPSRLHSFQEKRHKYKKSLLHRPNDWAKKIEIVIPCYNHGSYLKEAFNSIKGQSYKGLLHVTFINDNSSDDSLKVMNSIQKNCVEKNLVVRVIDNPKNLNQAGSINKAISTSNNELFIMLNADDILTEDCIDTIVQTYSINKELWMLGGSSIWFEDGDKLPIHKATPISKLELSTYGPSDIDQFTYQNAINMSQSSCSFFKDAWELADGYYPLWKRITPYDDRDFQMRVCSLLKVGVYKNYPMIFYRTTSSTGRARI